MFAAIGIGASKLVCCQPVAVSFWNAALASSVPVLVQSLPTWGPVLAGPLKKRMPVTKPGTSAWNLTPTSTGRASLWDGIAGSTESSQTEHGQP